MTKRLPQKDHWYVGSGMIIKSIIKNGGKNRLKKEIIWETDSPEKLNHLEQTFITLYKSLSPRGYNLDTGGKGNRIFSEETRRRIGDKTKGRKVREDTKTKIRQTLYNQNHLAKNFRLKSPSGEIIEGSNLRKFCRENLPNFDTSGLYAVSTGKIPRYKGWTNPDNPPKEKGAIFRFIFESGEIREGSSLKKFAEEIGVEASSIWALSKDKIKKVKGWRNLGGDDLRRNAKLKTG